MPHVNNLNLLKCMFPLSFLKTIEYNFGTQNSIERTEHNPMNK